MDDARLLPHAAYAASAGSAHFPALRGNRRPQIPQLQGPLTTDAPWCSVSASTEQEGAGGGINLQLAWAYIILRIIHSIVQATWNVVAVRFRIFSLSTLALLGLAINAVRATL